MAPIEYLGHSINVDQSSDGFFIGLDARIESPVRFNPRNQAHLELGLDDLGVNLALFRRCSHIRVLNPVAARVFWKVWRRKSVCVCHLRSLRQDPLVCHAPSRLCALLLSSLALLGDHDGVSRLPLSELQVAWVEPSVHREAFLVHPERFGGSSGVHRR